MTDAWKPAGFAAALAALLGGGLLAGSLLDPGAPRARAAAGHGDAPMAMAAGDHDAEVHGLAVAADGLRLVVDTPELPRGRTAALRFRVVDERGAAVRDFDVEHTKRMHLIVARRDLAGFQHLHPVQQRDGSWRARVRLPLAGSHRVFADFSHDGRAATLASDVRVDGPADLRALPAPASAARSDGGQRVALAPSTGRIRAGRETELRFAVPARTQPYLGAGGHLVALREGDLAFLHVHPTSRPGARGPVAFAATFPTPGRYRLFLQYRTGGRIHTVAFTREVAR